jgi:hypothetical protein
MSLFPSSEVSLEWLIHAAVKNQCPNSEQTAAGYSNGWLY